LDTVTLASDLSEALALERMEAHHVELSAGLALRVDAVTKAARGRDEGELLVARDELVAWCREELEPHAGAEEVTLYSVARDRPELGMLVRAMSHEHGLLVSLIARVGATADAVGLAEASGALRTLFDSHVAKENELILPALAAQRSTSLAGVLVDMHAHMDASATSRDIGAHHTATPRGHSPSPEPSTADDGGGHACGCHETEAGGHPELDARAVPHAIRHATVFGALDAVPDGSGMVLVAPHDPLPLLAQIEQRHPGVFDVRYLERGPDAWRLLFERRSR
jgi:uncharacterized protein (DUF2249 family)